MGPLVYFIHSAVLPSIYLSLSMYVSLALMQINTICNYSYVLKLFILK